MRTPFPPWTALLLSILLVVVGKTSASSCGADNFPGSSSIQETHTLHERRVDHDDSTRWEVVKRAEPDAVIPVRIGMKQGNVKKGEDILMDITNPNSPNYGNHLTSSSVVDLFAPSDEAVATVKTWLAEAGVVATEDEARLSANKQWVAFSTTVEAAEKLLHAEYFVHEHSSTGIQSIGCAGYHLPHAVSALVDYVTPGVGLRSHGYGRETTRRAAETKRRKRMPPSPPPKVDKRVTDVLTADGPDRLAMAAPMEEMEEDISVVAPAADAADQYYQPPRLVPVFGCEYYNTVECQREQYKIPVRNTTSPESTLGIYQGLGQHYSQEDLDTFFYTMSPRIPNGTHPEHNLVNGAFGPAPDQQSAGSEASLDFQIAYPLVWPSNPVLWQVDDEVYELNQTDPSTPFRGFFNNFWNALDGSYCDLEAFGQKGNCADDGCRDAPYPNPHPDGWKGQGHMCGVFEPSSVISMSYAGAEVDLPPRYHRRQCLEMLKLGLQGVTVVVASGDDGVAGFPGDPYPNGCLGADRTVFNPLFLASCPYVTAVGSTLAVVDRAATEALREARNQPPDGISIGDDALWPNATTTTAVDIILPADPVQTVYKQVATRRFKSGAGFSNLFRRPDYQAAHVASYLAGSNAPSSHVWDPSYVSANGTSRSDTDAGYDPGSESYPSSLADFSCWNGTASGRFNSAGRAYPDVSAAGDNIPIWHRGRFVRMGGTSASAPLFASLLALVNEERVAAGKKTVGFVNPVLYANPSAFADVTEGDSAGCDTTGFHASRGWDPVSGLGTPIFPKLLEVFMALP